MFKQSLNNKKSKINLSRDWLLLLICLFSLMGFLLVTYYRTSFFVIDQNVSFWAASIQSNAVTIIAIGVDFVFDTPTLIAVSLVISGYLFFKNYRSESLLLLGAMAGDALIIEATKNIVESVRPLNGLETGFSFPSGHSAGVIVFVGLLVFFALQHWNSARMKAMLGVVLVGLTLLVGFDRLYLNVHWFSDVLGGYLIGIFWLAFSILMFYVLRDAGKFQSKRFKSISSVIFVLAIIVAMAVIAASFLGFP